jgi:hypothetical protein
MMETDDEILKLGIELHEEFLFRKCKSTFDISESQDTSSLTRAKKTWFQKWKRMMWDNSYFDRVMPLVR